MFVLDRTQVDNLHEFLSYQLRRLKKTRWPNTVNLREVRQRERRRLERRRQREQAR